MRITNDDIDNELNFINGTMKKYKLIVGQKNGYYIIDIGYQDKANTNIYSTMITGITKREIYTILGCIETFIKYKNRKF